MEQSVAGNLAMIESERLPKDREAYLREMRKRPFEMVYGKYIDEMSKGTELRWMLRRALGNKRYDFIRTLGRKRKWFQKRFTIAGSEAILCPRLRKNA